MIANPTIGAAPTISLAGFEGGIPVRLIASILDESGDCPLLGQLELTMEHRAATGARGRVGFFGWQRLAGRRSSPDYWVVVGFAGERDGCVAGLVVVEGREPDASDWRPTDGLRVHGSRPVHASWSPTLPPEAHGLVPMTARLLVVVTEQVDG